MRGLLIGRFQPFHLGHEYLIERIDEAVDEVVVGIGSAGESHSKKVCVYPEDATAGTV